MERGEPISPSLIDGVRRVRRWRSGHSADSACRYVTVGSLPDGRWFAERTQLGARAYRTEAEARMVAGNLMGDRDDWQEVPAEMGPNGPGEGWRRQGGSWVRD